MKKWLLPLVVLALFTAGAAADRLDIEVVDIDAQFQPVESTHRMVDGDSVAYYFTTSGPTVFTADSLFQIVPDVVPAWLNVQFEEKAGTGVAWFRFKELDEAGSTRSAATYTWGNWVPVYLGGEYRPVSFKCGLWESCFVRVVGGSGESNFYWFVEAYRD